MWSAPLDWQGRDAFDTRLTWHWLIGGLLALLVAAMTLLTTRQNVNWDEFYFLQLVHDYVREDPVRALQTFHVHLMQWLVHLPVGDMGQVFAGRLLMLGLLCATAGFIYVIARGFTAPLPALIAMLAFASSGYVVLHGASFRADPLIACLLMGALAIVFRTGLELRWMVLAAGLAALAVVVSIKSVLYLPAFLAVLVWRGRERGLVARVFVTGGIFALMALALYLWHSAQLDRTGTEGTAEATASAVRTTLLSSGFLPRAPYVWAWALQSAAPLMLGLVALLTARRAPRDGLRLCLTLTLLALPCASVLFYRNAFPYFFPFIVPPLMVVVAVGVSRLSSRPVILAALVLAMVASGASQLRRAAGETNMVQARTLAAVHAMFPAPVAYIDRNGMVPSFDKVGFFMSSWGMKNYRDAGQPLLAPLVRDRQPPLVISNTPVLIAALNGTDATCGGLLPPDCAALRDNYVHHSGAIWLAGKTLRLDTIPQTHRIEISGRYTLHAQTGITANGTRHSPGSTVTLAQGNVRLSADTPTALTLMLAVPGDATATAPGGEIYAGF